MEYFSLLLALLLVFANGFFVATEFAIVKIRPSRIQALVEEGRPGATNAKAMVERLDSYLSATQFGITLASLGLGWLGEPAFARIIEPIIHKLLPLFAGLPGITHLRIEDHADRLTHTIGLVISFGIITFLHIVVGELAPKSLAIQKAEPTTLFVGLPMRIFHFIFYPGIFLLNGLAARLLKAIGITPVTEHNEAHSEDELKLILHSSADAGAIAESRAELLGRALEMLEKTVRQVLVPRNQVRYLDLDEPLDKNIAEARLGGHTWLPVCRGNLDQVEGLVNVKDLFFLLSRGELRSLAQVQRSVLFVPEHATLEQLLSEFRRRKRQLAMVVDEHGGTTGIVTLADVVAEVVGDVAEMGRRVAEVKTLPGGRLELPGSTQLDDLEDRIGSEFGLEEDENEEVTTVAGLMMWQLGRVPQKGDKITVGEYEVRAEEVEGARVVRVRIEPKEKLQPPVKAQTDGEKPSS